MTERIVPTASLPWIGVAILVCVGSFVATGWTLGWAVLGLAFLFGIWRGWLVPLVVVLGVAALSFLHPTTLVPVGPIQADVVLDTEVTEGRYGSWAVGELGEAEVFLDLPSGSSSGAQLHVVGVVTEEITSFAGRPRQIVKVQQSEPISSRDQVYRRLGNFLRQEVHERLADGTEAQGLLAGFVVGDVSGISEATQDAMRRAGLSHFVAVSGSNVALFLALVVAVTIPFGIGPKRRAIFGLVALPVFVVATRFEPSVMRASVMAGVVLGGKVFDMALEAWQTISIAVVGLLFVDPWLIRSVGFQLSLAATVGVLVGARWPTSEGIVVRALLVTVGAQLAVAPLLLIHFGTVPLLSPLSNLAAAPLVSIATILAIPGAVGFGPSMAVAEFASGLVIQIAHTAAGWPQLGWVGLASLVLTTGLGRLLWTRSAETVAVAVAVVLVGVILVPGGILNPGEVVVLDVGQGDAILISGGDGRYALVDGGPSEATLLRHLRRYGVKTLDLVVLSHVHADHVTGLLGLFGKVAIGEIWTDTEPHSTSASERLLELARQYDVPVRTPPLRLAVPFGELTLRPLGPIRRYASPNDQSIVLSVEGRVRSILLTGDIEVFAQSELTDLRADVLKVPHQGGATSDPEWLGSVGATEAVISVGPNDFGHPAPWVIEVLESSGAKVWRTDRDGSVVIELGR